MSRSGDLWMTKYEECGNNLAAGNLTRTEAEVILAELGFDEDEIADHIETVLEQATEDNSQFGVGA